MAFDVGQSDDPQQLNRRFDSLARFIKMHVANGVPSEHIELALVVHGKASADLLNDLAFEQKFDSTNPNTLLIRQLLKNPLAIYLSGQSGAYHGIEKSLLMDGVQLALSAMTAHVLLARQSYTINPF